MVLEVIKYLSFLTYYHNGNHDILSLLAWGFELELFQAQTPYVNKA